MANHSFQVQQNQVTAPLDTNSDDAQIRLIERLARCDTKISPPAPHHQNLVFITGNIFQTNFYFFFLMCSNNY